MTNSGLNAIFTAINIIMRKTMNTASKLCVALLACAAIQAHASVITLQTGKSTATTQASATDLRDVVEAAVSTPTSGYGTKVLSSYNSVSNAGQFGANNDIAWKSTVEFGVTAAQAGTWSFRTGVDFGYGGALFLDGTALAFNPNSMWWNGNYNNASQFLQATLNLSSGTHTLSIYGLENCCDGAAQAQFRISNGQFTSFASNDGLNVVPEPATLASFALGLGLIAGVRRRNKGA